MYDLYGGYLLLCSKLGNSGRKPLTHKEFHKFLKLGTADIAGAVGMRGCPVEVKTLIEDVELMQRYAKSVPADITPLILTDPRYPRIIKDRLADEAPGILWSKGNMALMNRPAVALVGSRKLTARAEEFARGVGRMAAREGYVLVSGNATGADGLAQEACLAAGGCVISVVADTLLNKEAHDRILYLAEDDFEADFNRARALSRNQVIHAFGQRTYVAQANVVRSGTWSGVTRNMKNGWSPLIMHADGSEAARRIAAFGGTLVTPEEL